MLTAFRRALGFLWPHRRSLFIGLVAAIGVSLFYTFSVSSIVPVLKIIFAEHESIVDWLHRAEAERRVGITVPPDLPNDPAGLLVNAARGENAFEPGERIVAIDGVRVSSYEAVRKLARTDAETVDDVKVLAPDGASRATSLTLRPHKWWWTLAAGIASALPTDTSPDGRFRTLAIMMAAVITIALLGGVCRFVNEGFIAVAVQRTMHDLRCRLAEHTLRLPVNWHSAQPSGDTLARFANDLSRVEVGIATLFGKTVREPLKAVGVLSLTILIDWRMLVIGAIGLPIGALMIRTFGRLVKRAQRRASQSWGRLLDHLGERLVGIRVVKASGMEGAESRRFANEGRVLMQAQTHIEMVDAASKPVLETLASLAISGFILYGGYRVFHGYLEPHLFFGAVICLGGIFDPLRKMSNVNNRLQAAEAAAQRLFDVIDQEVEASASADAQPALKPVRQAITFEDVTFAYPSNTARPVLQGVNLRIEKGQMIALVGPNGSGKTTLMALLLRFFDAQQGRICIDGQDIAGVALDSLRGQIGLVTQEPIIFSDTVRANIAYGAPDADDAAIRTAARLARADDFVQKLRVERDGRISTGYDAEVTTQSLSGGQRQRLVLARAILRDPSILILDEATSQIDTESERRIQEALEDVTRDRTTFVIAHRLSTVARADITVVLDEGRVVGVGKPDELTQTCSVYNTLVQTQLAAGIQSTE